MIEVRILFIRSRYGYPDSRVEKEIYSLSKEHEVDLLGWDRSKWNKVENKIKIRINDKWFTYYHIGVKAPIGKGFKKTAIPILCFWIRVWIFLIKYAKHYDVLHVCDFDTAFPVMLVPGHFKIVYDIFDYYADAHASPAIIDYLIRKFENQIIRRSDVTIICSEARREQIWPAEPKKLVVIHNTPSCKVKEEIQPLNSDSQKGRFKIVYVGSLSEDRFLREIGNVIVNRKDIELHIGGIGVLDDHFSSLARKHQNIFYYGALSYPKVLDLESRCDIMTAIYNPCIPNHKYAAPNKFYESLMLGKPLIMMRNTGMDTYVTTYELGEVIDVGGADGFSDGFSRALDSLIAKKCKWREIGERGRRLYKEQFHWDEMEKRLLSIYDDLK